VSTDRLTTAHERTLEAVFGHPLPHNLQWHDVLALFEALGTVKEDHRLSGAEAHGSSQGRTLR